MALQDQMMRGIIPLSRFIVLILLVPFFFVMCSSPQPQEDDLDNIEKNGVKDHMLRRGIDPEKAKVERTLSGGYAIEYDEGVDKLGPAFKSSHMDGPKALLGPNMLTVSFDYGVYTPLGAYGDRYSARNYYGCSLLLHSVSLFGMIPGITARQAGFEGEASGKTVASTMKISQILGSLTYRNSLRSSSNLPDLWFLKKRMEFSVSVLYGITRMEFESTRHYPVVEWVHTASVSAGALFRIHRGIGVGFDAGYVRIFSAGEDFSGYLLSVRAEMGW